MYRQKIQFFLNYCLSLLTDQLMQRNLLKIRIVYMRWALFC